VTGLKNDKNFQGMVWGVLLAFFGIVVIGTGFDRIGGFIDIPTFAINFSLTFAVLFAICGVRGTWESFKIAFYAQADTRADAENAYNVCSLGMKATFLASVCGMLIGLVAMLSQGMDDPSVLTSGMAVALLCPLWGVFAAMIFYVAIGRVQRVCVALAQTAKNDSERFDSALGSSPKERNGFVHGLAFPLMILLPLFSFFVLLFTMTEKSGVSGERYFAVKLINQSDKIVKVNMSSVRISKAVDDKPAHVLPSDTEADFFGFVRLVIGEEKKITPWLRPYSSYIDTYLDFIVIDQDNGKSFTRRIRLIPTEHDGKYAFKPLVFYVKDEMFASQTKESGKKNNDTKADKAADK